MKSYVNSNPSIFAKSVKQAAVGHVETHAKPAGPVQHRPGPAAIRKAYTQLVKAGFSPASVSNTGRDSSGGRIRNTKADATAALRSFGANVPAMATQARTVATYADYSIKSLREMKVPKKDDGIMQMQQFRLNKGDVFRTPDGRYAPVPANQLVSANQTLSHLADMRALGHSFPELTVGELLDAFGVSSLGRIASTPVDYRHAILNTLMANRAPSTSVPYSVSNAKLQGVASGEARLRVYADPKALAEVLGFDPTQPVEILSLEVHQPSDASSSRKWPKKQHAPNRGPDTPAGWQALSASFMTSRAAAKTGIGLVMYVQGSKSNADGTTTTQVRRGNLTTPGNNIMFSS